MCEATADVSGGGQAGNISACRVNESGYAFRSRPAEIDPSLRIEVPEQTVQFGGIAQCQDVSVQHWHIQVRRYPQQRGPRHRFLHAVAARVRRGVFMDYQLGEQYPRPSES